MNHFVNFLKKNILLLSIQFVTIVSLSLLLSFSFSITQNTSYFNYQVSFEHFENCVELNKTYPVYKDQNFNFKTEDLVFYDGTYGEDHWFLNFYNNGDVSFLADPSNRLKDGYFAISENLSLFDKSELSFTLNQVEMKLKKANGYLDFENTILFNLNTLMEAFNLSFNEDNYFYLSPYITILIDETNLQKVWNYFINKSDYDTLSDFGCNIDLERNVYAGIYSYLVFMVPLFLIVVLLFAYLYYSSNSRNFLLSLRLGKSKISTLRDSFILYCLFFIFSFLLTLILILFVDLYLVNFTKDMMDIGNAIYFDFALNLSFVIIVYLFSYLCLSDKKLVENIRNDD